MPFGFIVAPIASFLLLSLFRAEKSVIIREATLDNYVNFFSNWTYAGTYLGTLALCFQVMVVSVILGYPIAWFIWQQRGSPALSPAPACRRAALHELHRQALHAALHARA